MGVPGSDLVEADMSRMNSDSAQRRRQATRLAAADIPEDEDDEFGSKAIEATSPDSDGDSDFEEAELPIIGESHVGHDEFGNRHHCYSHDACIVRCSRSLYFLVLGGVIYLKDMQ